MAVSQILGALIVVATMTTDVAVATTMDNTTYTYDRPHSTTSELVITSASSWSGQLTLPIVEYSLSCVAFVTNLAMLICLLVYKQAAKNNVNIFICNQTILHLVPMLPATIKFALLMSGYYTHTKTGVLSTFATKLKMA